jgi:hypothetical protein
MLPVIFQNYHFSLKFMNKVYNHICINFRESEWTCEIWGSHGGEDADVVHLGFDSV